MAEGGPVAVRVLSFLAAALAVLVVGCADDASSTDDLPADDVVLRVIDEGVVARDWSLADLEADVEFIEIVIDGDAQRGPRLIDVISASGVDEWETAEVLGMSEGRVLEVSLNLDADTVDDTWVFDITNRGTLKLAAPDLPRQQWVRDIGEIRFP